MTVTTLALNHLTKSLSLDNLKHCLLVIDGLEYGSTYTFFTNSLTEHVEIHHLLPLHVPLAGAPHSQKDSIPSPTFTACRYKWSIKLVRLPSHPTTSRLEVRVRSTHTRGLITSAKNHVFASSRYDRST
ncbi:uncharacterized protein FFB20_11492 [Fusarium fujikuroi]|uniref:Uncharacterized protein n=1 Tax=Gibberella fujikuroi (strain CBS 195.34 / IMI 58289 / NRRL A-6831) TaxID=1279085 RepID=S0DJF5_GIBF5|nr:uncharacterized protein FFUJ_00770 [Fusarium fujikuroi IMI 58289]SCN67091.1 uncharacterized protein FFE2_00838 [Fusarium fujikuroi]CCT62659.1 uncharacterized protein FFUJ_00770 [Fusarium fujikuroi IMI 58289]SCN70215.1 uncharacterized protein FFC1_00834 [Fusarium fujikuroi]SCN73941.1 uncharacterized protein FFM5_00795 [Fusarium fujikuroi]SCO01876.1 uncharacterized protein FFB20_11492 [Fusarium fujikuroi]